MTIDYLAPFNQCLMEFVLFTGLTDEQEKKNYKKCNGIHECSFRCARCTLQKINKNDTMTNKKKFGEQTNDTKRENYIASSLHVLYR